jgi:ribosomal protein S27AE
MCCIFSVFERDPSEELLREGARRNTDGIGLAWPEGPSDNPRAIIKWKKGIKDVEEVIERVQKGIPRPYLIHFRKKSSGEIDPSLTHPFPLEMDVPLDLEGETNQGVLAHNGTWINWQRESAHAVFSLGKRVPWGLWSDSRMLAYLVANYGHNALQFFDWGTSGRIAILYPGHELPVIFNRSEWTKKEGFWMSQDLEKTTYTLIDGDDWRHNYASVWSGHHRDDRRTTPIADTPLEFTPQNCPKCGDEGDINYHMPGRQWCSKCHEFFSVETDDQKKRSQAPSRREQKGLSQEETISKIMLARFASDMFARQWWSRDN